MTIEVAIFLHSLIVVVPFFIN